VKVLRYNNNYELQDSYVSFRALQLRCVDCTSTWWSGVPDFI